MELEFENHHPSAEEYNYLRKSVGWSQFDPSVIDKSLSHSLYSITVYKDGKIIGMGRVVGDKSICFYIQDIIVIPDFQNQGIGFQIMSNIMDFIKANGTNKCFVGLMSAVGREDFYSKFGFIKRPNDKLGSGMTLFLKRQ